MHRKSLLDRLPGALEHAYSHFRQHRQPAEGCAETPAGPALTIALSREAGVRATCIAHEVGELLGWPVYDHELLERIAEEMGLSAKLLKEVDEKPARWILQRMETFLANPRVNEPAYLEHLIGTLLSLSAHGHCVVVGRGSVHLLPPKTTLRVRLMAPRQHRIEAMAATLNLSQEEAARQVDRIDRERSDFVRQHFDKDPVNPHHFDVIVNAVRFSPRASAELIVEAAHRMEAALAPPAAVEASA